MTKYILGTLSAVVSFLLGATAFADNYSVQVLNLPLVQAPNMTFTFDMSVSSSFSGDEQKATLYVDDCGKDLAVSYQSRVRPSVPLLLSPNGKQEFPLTLYRSSNDECILTFKLFDDNQTLLTSTKVGVLPQCPYERERAKKPIDEGLDYKLPGIAPISKVPVGSNLPSTSSTSPSPVRQNQISSSSTSSSQKANQQPQFLTYTDDELKSAFNLLVEKGILTAEDEARLQNPLTRIEAARYFVDIALVNDLSRDESKWCTFPDLKNASAEDVAVARLVCQFNIMGVNPDYTPLDNFMPSMVIPSEQLVTAFSRLMWRNLYEKPENADYYELHFNTMENLWLVNNRVIKAESKLTDFVIIAARAINTEQLIIKEILPETSPTEKKKFWFF